MAKKIKTFISPGVFTSEVDVSFLGPGVGQIGAAIIGTAPKGPAFVPVTVSNFNEYVTHFGDLDPDFYMSYAAKAYLKNAGTANIVRVLGPAGKTANGSAVNPGYTAESVWGIIGITGSANAYLHALIEVTGSDDIFVVDKTDDLFEIRITGSDQLSFTCSFLTSSAKYVKKVLNTDPSQFKAKKHYLRDVYDFNIFKHGRNSTAPGHAVYASMSFGGMTNFQMGFNSASSPWIMSQIFGGASGEEYDLFRVHTLGHGDAENGRFKVSVSNIKVSPVPSIDDHGSFDLELRSFTDTDKNRSVVERFPGLSLDPGSNNYIAKRIGDRHWEWNETKEKMVSYGNYPNVSSFIRVEMNTGSFPSNALPWGFRGLAKPALMYISGTGAEEHEEGDLAADVADVIGDLPLVGDLRDKETGSEVKSYIYWGAEFDLSGNIAARLTKYPTMTASDSNFSLRYVSGSTGTGDPAAASSTNTGFVYNSSNPEASQKEPGDSSGDTTIEPKYARFTVPLAFGFDGWDKTDIEDPLDNVTQLAATTQIGVQALRQAVDIVKDEDFIDINLLAIPGIYSTQVVDYAIDAIEERSDAFYVFDMMNHSSSATTVSTTVTEAKNRGYDTNYAATYYPGIKIVDPVSNKIVELPSSIAALGAISFNDRVAFPWFAPAGLNRGGLNQDSIGYQVTEAIDRLTSTERDDLYENRVNPIASFPGEGIAIWGQKTMQAKASALDRINVRRLLIKAKKLIASSTKYMVFEQNNASTWTRFKQMVNPILADIQRKNGLEAFRVVMDETTNTPDIIDRNIMAGQIYLKPTRTAEFITLDFIITRSGASFEE